MAKTLASYLCYKKGELIPYNVICLKGDSQYIIRMWKSGNSYQESMSDTPDVANAKLNILLKAFERYNRM